MKKLLLRDVYISDKGHVWKPITTSYIGRDIWQEALPGLTPIVNTIPLWVTSAGQKSKKALSSMSLLPNWHFREFWLVHFADNLTQLNMGVNTASASCHELFPIWELIVAWKKLCSKKPNETWSKRTSKSEGNQQIKQRTSITTSEPFELRRRDTAHLKALD